MDAMECFRTRRSIRSYKDQPVPRDVIESIVDVGHLAATGMNLQPCHFVVVTDAAMRQNIADITQYGKFIAQAPVCIAVISEDVKYYIEDGSAAVQNILNAARANGLGSCWVAGDKKPYADDLRKLLGAPDGYKLIALIAIGYAAEERQTTKKPLAEVMHWESFRL